MKTCALCGFRDATTTTDWDGRIVACCARCNVPEIDVTPEVTLTDDVRALVAAIAEPATTAQLEARLGRKLTGPIAALARAGLIERCGSVRRGATGNYSPIWRRKEAA